MQTSNFATCFANPNAVAICRGIPRNFKGKLYQDLAPTREMLNLVGKDPAKFDEMFAAILAKLDPKAIYEALGSDAILLCYEPFNTRCHRRQVAEWLETQLGIEVAEFGHQRSESLPYVTLPKAVKKSSTRSKPKVSQRAQAKSKVRRSR